MRYFISDTHWGHKNIINFCGRPYKDLPTMNQSLIDNWNSIITKDDVVYHLGDFSFGDVKKYASKLNGKKILIIGNHDRESQCIGHFEEIHKNLEIEINSKKVLLCHHPWKHLVGLYDNKFLKEMPEMKDDGVWLLSGHVHHTRPRIDKQNRIINCCVEVNNYRPISELEITEIIK